MGTARKTFDCAVIGDWHLAFITAASLAKLGHRTLLVNPMSPGAEPWSGFPTLSLAEPGLAECIAESRAAGRLEYANGVSADWDANFVWLAIDTPVNDRDEPDLTPLEEVIRRVSESANTRRAFVITSQIPMGFSQRIEKQTGLAVAYVPENLRLGKGLETFLKADRFVIGATAVDTREQVASLVKDVPAEIILCDLPTSEMVKHATNAFLATSISFANEMAKVGELMGADNQLVGKALKADRRIGKGAYVSPGLGFAGGTLPRDLRVLQKIAGSMDRKVPLVDAVLGINESINTSLIDSLRLYLGSLEGKRVLVIGYTYKAEIDTLRRSSSLELAQELKQKGAQVWGYDPVMNDRDLAPIKEVLKHFPQWNDFAECPDAVVLMTPRPQFASVDWKSLARASGGGRKPCLVLDTRSLLKSENVLGAGLAYKPLWQPIQTA